MLKYLPVALLFLGLGACIEPIDLDLQNEPGILVVEGVITNGPGPHKVNVSRTVSGQRVPEPVSAAQVFLVDDQGNTFPYFQELPGEHTLPFGAVNAYPGVSYAIQVILPDGSTYESAPERMPGLLAKDSTYYDLTEFTEINENGISISTNSIEAYIDSDIPTSEEPLYYRWVMEEAYEFKPTDFPDPFGIIPAPCYFISSPDPQRINLFNSLEQAAGKVEGRLLARRAVNSALLHRYFIIVNQFGLTEAAYNYWDNVRKNIEQTGSIFDVPPATVRGNIRNINDPTEPVYGYFSASPATLTRTLLRATDVPDFIPDPCQFDPFRGRREYPAVCISCFESNGVVDKPEYF